MTAGTVALRCSVTRHAARAVILAAAALLVLVLVVGGIGGGSASSGAFAPSAVAIADIPGNYLVWYERAAQRFGVDWAILAAIAKLECNHGRLEAPGCNPRGTVNDAGATGPIQFLGPTWRSG